ncbi:hypothetical protein C2857_004072 [Epichloe festucae Fl1]|uniref:Glycolipid transfer protein domain-containing protein n=1 Tax=Epichloe festucae (strain Fl1) TaxID=877507 RepID=A0A7U3Q0J5_EPIFF|nr:hypothetical protein C2857_004072 [Epichloe festucae Fl1]
MSAPVIPPGGTIVQTFRQSFVDVPIDADKGNAIATTQFLDAAESLTSIFGPLPKRAQDKEAHCHRGSPLADSVRVLPTTDLLRKANPSLQRRIFKERWTFTDKYIRTCSGLEFTSIALCSNLADPSKELSESFRGAYGQTLKPHHSFLVKPVFSAAMSACPYRKDFYAKLGSDDAKVQQDLRVYLAALEKIVGILKGFLESKDAKW